jgi:SecD/SecF fusion protein
VTLSIGVLASMVSALVITRVLAEWAVNRPVVMRRPALSGLGATGRVRDWLTRRNPDLLKRRATLLGISAAAALLAVTGIVVRGLDLGVEFTGGRLVEYSTSSPFPIDDAREVVSDAGFPRAIVQTSGSDGGGENISVRTAEMTNDQEAEVRAALAEQGGDVTKVRDELIGPSLGNELRDKALLALGIALIVQLIYLAVRFRWTFGGAAVLAMLHDVVIVTGTFAWLGKPIDGVFLAALLTVIGYSVNDSVVVFDRVREMRATDRKSPFATVANSAVIQTVPRTVNTGMGAVFILATLLFVGGDSLADFALALLLGVAIGTYSSVFTATPLAVVFDARSPHATASTRTKATTARTSGAVR